MFVLTAIPHINSLTWRPSKLRYIDLNMRILAGQGPLELNKLFLRRDENSRGLFQSRGSPVLRMKQERRKSEVYSVNLAA